MSQQQHFTQIDINKLSMAAITPHFETLMKKHGIVGLDKYTFILIGSILFFAASMSFWIYVTFYM